jgi:hypothetical protein
MFIRPLDRENPPAPRRRERPTMPPADEQTFAGRRPA